MAGFFGINLLTANSGGTLAEMLALNTHTNFKKNKKNVKGEAQWHWDSDIYCKGVVLLSVEVQFFFALGQDN